MIHVGQFTQIARASDVFACAVATNIVDAGKPVDDSKALSLTWYMRSDDSSGLIQNPRQRAARRKSKYIGTNRCFYTSFQPKTGYSYMFLTKQTEL